MQIVLVAVMVGVLTGSSAVLVILGDSTVLSGEGICVPASVAVTGGMGKVGRTATAVIVGGRGDSVNSPQPTSRIESKMIIMINRMT
jgi:hypothetical protein